VCRTAPVPARALKQEEPILKVILRDDVRDLGRNGELVEVKQGYARNFLLPRSLAVPATAGNLKDFQKRIAVAKEREARDRTAANALADKLRGRRFLLIRKPADHSTRLHGSVTSVDLAEIISKDLGQEIDRRDVDLKQPIRALGEYQANVKLMRGLSVTVNILVAETEPVEEPEPVEAPAAEAPAAAAESVDEEDEEAGDEE
jgi:large subunit ribosomal protein L9